MNIRIPTVYLDHLARNQHGCIVGYARDSEGRIDGLITLELFVRNGRLVSATADPSTPEPGDVGSAENGTAWTLVDLPGSPLEKAIDYNGMLIALDAHTD